MFSALMLNGITCKVRGTDVITINHCGTPRRMLELMKKLTEPTSLGHTISHATVLSFRAGSRNSGLSLGGPRNEVGPKKHTKP